MAAVGARRPRARRSERGLDRRGGARQREVRGPGPQAPRRRHGEGARQRPHPLRRAGAPLARRRRPPQPRRYPYAQTFTLHSRPGQQPRASTWTSTARRSPARPGTALVRHAAPSFYAEPFSLDATPGAFSDAEQDVDPVGLAARRRGLRAVRRRRHDAGPRRRGDRPRRLRRHRVRHARADHRRDRRSAQLQLRRRRLPRRLRHRRARTPPTSRRWSSPRTSATARRTSPRRRRTRSATTST